MSAINLIEEIRKMRDYPLDTAHSINKRTWSDLDREDVARFYNRAVCQPEIDSLAAGKYKSRIKQPLLEIGCAGAHNLRYFFLSGMRQLYGLDISGPGVQVAKSRLPQADIREGDMVSLPQWDTGFNTIISRGVFHLTTTEGLLVAVQESWKALEEKGILYIFMRHKPSENDVIRLQPFRLYTYLMFKERYNPGISQEIDKVRNFTPPEAMEAILESVGFRLLYSHEIIPTIDKRGQQKFGWEYVCEKRR